MVKAVRRSRGTDEVWDLWKQADPLHVVPLLATAVDGDIGYEVTPWQPAGSLLALLRPDNPVDEQTCRDVVVQVAGALRHIHTGLARRLVHRDVKPANLLLDTGGDGVVTRVRLTDFGVAVAQDESYTYTASAAGTPAYDAPEASAGASSPARDWWSLGMIAVELRQGHHPYAVAGRLLDIGPLTAEVATAPIPLDDDLDPRWRLLGEGLLTRDPRRRWGHEQVEQWLVGRSPRVDDAAHGAAAPGRPFPIGAVVVHTPEELAAAIAADWTAGAALVVGRGWTEARAWAAAFTPELGARMEEVDRAFVAPRAPVDRQVAELLVRLDPTRPPTFAGFDLDGDGLARLARTALDDREAERAVAALFESGALRALAGLSGRAALAAVDDRWHELVDMAARAVAGAVGADATLPRPRLLYALLLGAVVDPDVAPRLAARVRELLGPRTRRVAWFRKLAEGFHGTDAVAGHAAMLLTAPLLDDPAHTIPEAARQRARERLAAAVARGRPVRPTRAERKRARRRRWTVLACLVGGLLLVAPAGAGVGLATSPEQGALTAGLMAAAALALTVGAARPGRRYADALLCGWAAAVAGLPLAVVAAVPVGALAGSSAGWTTFWVLWVAVIMIGTTLGAVW